MQKTVEWLLETLKDIGLIHEDTKLTDDDIHMEHSLMLWWIIDTKDDPNLLAELLARGARPNETHFTCDREERYFEQLIDACDETDLSLIFERMCSNGTIHTMRTMLEYGAKIPSWWAPRMTTTKLLYVESNRACLFEHASVLQRRVAACRRSLLALIAYCKRSPYTALRAVYKELCKWIWRMRGGGERCGPRVEKWEK